MFTLLVKDMYSSLQGPARHPVPDPDQVPRRVPSARRLIRGREFVMKDAYSFTIDEEGMRKAYYDERALTSVSSSVLT